MPVVAEYEYNDRRACSCMHTAATLSCENKKSDIYSLSESVMYFG